MPVQVFDNGSCTFSTITSGIIYAIHNGADVINVSIGPNFSGMDALPEEDQEMISREYFKNEEIVWKRIISIANEHNSIIVFAAGNDNIIARVAPENRTDLTINVAAVDPKIKGTDFTNYGPGSNISAPGESIISSMPGNTYEFSDGTSMAAPIVTGTVALMKSCNPDITVSEVLDILQRTGEYVAAGIPPLIQVDDALIAQTTGVFPDRSAEQEVEVPSDRITRTPAPAPVLAPAPSPSPKPKPRPDAGTDYDAIRELIEAYKKKISELEKLLPENQ
jgi:subtilisin family serine protease